MRFKTVSRGGQRLGLVELSAGFVEPARCRKAHTGWVLEGQLEIEFPEGRATYRAGQGVFLLADEAERHRARAIGEVARLILVEAE